MTQTKLVKVTAEGKLDFPSEILVNLQPGDEYILWQQEDTIMLKKVEKFLDFSDLWQKIDELGEDINQPSMAEITTMVKEVRSKLSKNE